MRPYIPHSLPPQGGKEPLLSSRLAFWYALTVTEIRVLAQSFQLQLAIWRSNAFTFAFHNVGVRFIGPEEGLDESSPDKFLPGSRRTAYSATQYRSLKEAAHAIDRTVGGAESIYQYHT